MRIAALASVGLLALALAACGGGNDDDNPTPSNPAPIPAAQTCNNIGGIGILNGANCSTDTSSVVLLNMEGNGVPIGSCSGTIVARRKILTAAHCLDEGVGLVRVWLGPPSAQIVAQSFVHYPGYVFNNPNVFDVGVITMADDLPRGIVPVLLSRDARVGETAIIAGWGRDQNDAGATLRSGSTMITVVGGLLQTPFAPPSSSVCSGDSGGPILLQEGGAWSVGGITSATSANVCNTGTNFYQAVRHPSVTAFIEQHVPDVTRR